MEEQIEKILESGGPVFRIPPLTHTSCRNLGKRVSTLNFLSHRNSYASILITINQHATSYNKCPVHLVSPFTICSVFFQSYFLLSHSQQLRWSNQLFSILQPYNCLSQCKYSIILYPKNTFPSKFQLSKFYPHFVISTPAPLQIPRQSFSWN